MSYKVSFMSFKIFILVQLFSFLMNGDYVCFQVKICNACDVKKVKMEPLECEFREGKKNSTSHSL